MFILIEMEQRGESVSTLFQKFMKAKYGEDEWRNVRKTDIIQQTEEHLRGFPS